MKKLGFSGLFGVCLFILLTPVAGASSGSVDSGSYQLRESWQASLLASERALAQIAAETEIAAFESEVFRGGDSPVKVRVRVTGMPSVYLFVAGDPDVKWGVADWAEARLIERSGEVVPIGQRKSEIKILEGRHEYDLTLRSGLYQKMSLQGRSFDQGLHVQANSGIQIPLRAEDEWFEAWVGVDDWAGTNGSVRFSVTGPRQATRKLWWNRLAQDFADGPSRLQMEWERQDRIWDAPWNPTDWKGLARRYADASRRITPLAARMRTQAGSVHDESDLTQFRRDYYRSRELAAALDRLRSFAFGSLRLALLDLEQTFGDRYSEGERYRARLDELEKESRRLLGALSGQRGDLEAYETLAKCSRALEDLRRQALLRNPLLDFDRLLLVKRRPLGDPRRSQWEDRGLGEYLGLPKQSSWHVSTIPRTDIWDNEIAVLSPVRPEGNLSTLYRSEGRRLLTDVDLHFDGDKLLFSMPNGSLRWQIHEIPADGGTPRQLTPGDQPDVHNYDACYLPNGNIAFLSTAVLQGVPCNAQVNVGMMYLMDARGGDIRQVCFEQDHDYCPAVLNDGRILYLRWDYTDTPHVWNRLLMAMNPDGTGQMEYYGSGSYWPNAIFFARPVPGHSTKIVGIVTGHHEGRVGELVIFDPARGRHEVEGVVQRIPGYGRPVEAKIEDKLTEHSWPKFLHPYPLSEKYFLAACKPEPDSLWGIYLVDVFDNRILLREEEGQALLEPIPFRAMRRPPVIPDQTQPDLTHAVVFLQDVYSGPGLKDVPRGTVKQLRLFTYHFGYQQVAGIDHRVGADGPWEVKRVLGTVPVEPDGSAFFRVPAKYPISLQPLDAEGKALALMRSWMTAMPGEIVSCVGCHERQGSAPPVQGASALKRQPSDIEPWHGPLRGFSFAREVQPVLNRYCVRCHEGSGNSPDSASPDLRERPDAWMVYEHGRPEGCLVTGVSRTELLGKYSAVFEPAYVALRSFVRVGGLESDLHVLPPMEFHADTSELVQVLKKGHYQVRLDAESWDRLITWIDLNAPCHGTWKETTRIPGRQQPERRQALRRLYGGIDENAEDIPDPSPLPSQALGTHQSETGLLTQLAVIETPAGWPFSAREAKRRQQRPGKTTRILDLGNGVKMKLVHIPAGAFVMGDASGQSGDARPRVMRVDRSFWMSEFEVSNEQYAQFDPRHDSRFEDRSSWIFSEAYLGWPLNRPRQPVVRVSWDQAMDFCRWLSGVTGLEATLPTEVQWEYACRAGTDTPLFFGDLDADFSRYGNLADASLRQLSSEGWRPLAPDVAVRDDRFNDGHLVTADTGSYLPNAWGLYDMHGNAAEWTRSVYSSNDRSLETPPAAPAGSMETEARVVRGGSWRDRPKRCQSSFRLGYPPYQRIFNVGFRVLVESD
ncbi:MAG TPA: SUMF1/EgtB/PvdO family nonheme iron enzyme [Candidatus Paceibacterota bacterium]|nr:SUMF1/EgtB/PvdO family nonheme iron enzyme [Candidatus Paceibacterota bacterium]